MRVALFLLLSSVVIYNQAQNIVASSTSIRTCVNEKECSSVNNPSYLFYDEKKNEFYLKIDPREIADPNPVNEWLKDLGDTALYFKGHFPLENFPVSTNHNSETFVINGQSYINGIWHNQTVELQFLAVDNNMLNPDVTGTGYEVYRVNFSFSFLPQDYEIEKKPRHLKNPIFISVAQGRINELKHGMEHHVREAYDHN